MGAVHIYLILLIIEELILKCIFFKHVIVKVSVPGLVRGNALVSR
jgi:hypothetical protein